jgi:sugar phosphate isomerase/epimerase
VTFLYSTAALAGAPEQARAITVLKDAGLVPIELGDLPGALTEPDAQIRAAHEAFLPAGPGRPNLAASDDDVRRQSVKAVCEALARCEWLGIPFYGISAGWNLTQTLLRDGTPSGVAGHRPHAMAQLKRSLDDLANVADGRQMEIGVAHLAPAHGGMMANPAEIRDVIEAIGAPHLRLSLDLGALAASHPAPDEAAVELADVVRLVRVPAWKRQVPRWILDVAAEFQRIPFVVGGRDLNAAVLRDLCREMEDAWHAPA